jgi:flavin-dependent dehydrogenase
MAVHTRRCDSTLLDLEGAESWLAVGDAVAAWDPLSSQGLAAGIVMAGRAAEAIAAGSNALREWREDLRMLAEDTWGMQLAYYRAEQRWPEAPFWAALQGK